MRSVVDAGATADGGASACLPQVKEEWGTPPLLSTTQYESSGRYTFYADLVDGPFQRLFITLRPETGVFTGPVQPGNYTIAGEETDYQWCGACVYLAVDDGETPSTLYMAESAQLQIDSVGAEVHGTLAEVTLRQIDIVYGGAACGGGGEWPCGNTGCSGGACGVQVEGPDCKTTIDSLSF